MLCWQNSAEAIPRQERPRENRTVTEFKRHPNQTIVEIAPMPSHPYPPIDRRMLRGNAQPPQDQSRGNHTLITQTDITQKGITQRDITQTDITQTGVLKDRMVRVATALPGRGAGTSIRLGGAGRWEPSPPRRPETRRWAPG